MIIRARRYITNLAAKTARTIRATWHQLGIDPWLVLFAAFLVALCAALAAVGAVLAVSSLIVGRDLRRA